MEVVYLKKNKNLTEAGTDIDEVKRLNENSGLSYNEVKAVLAKSGGYGTGIYSDTFVGEVNRNNPSTTR